MSLKSFAKKKTVAKKTAPPKKGVAGSALVATRAKPAAKTHASAAVAESLPTVDDVPLGPRGGKPAGLRPDRAVKLSVKVSHAQYRAIRLRAAEQSSNTQDILLAALVKLFEDDGLPFA